MSTFNESTYLSWAITGNGVVVASSDYAINSRVAPGGQVMTCAADQARYALDVWGQPGQVAHVWLGGGVRARLGGTLDGLRPADGMAS